MNTHLSKLGYYSILTSNYEPNWTIAFKVTGLWCLRIRKDMQTHTDVGTTNQASTADSCYLRNWFRFQFLFFIFKAFLDFKLGKTT